MVDEPIPGSTEAPGAEPAATLAIGRDESVPHAVRRIILVLLDGAMDDLQPSDDAGIDLGVHATRKKVKRIRAVLRLVRGSIGPTIYRTEDVSLRDTTRTISDMRDAAVLIETLDRVCGQHADAIDPDTLEHTRTWLMARYDRIRIAAGPQVRTEAVRDLDEIRTRFAAYPMQELITDDFDAVVPGLRRTYRRGRRDHRRSMADPTVHELHEWRKAVKYLRYQMETLETIEPDRIGAIARDLDELGELLGDDHDLAVLADAVRSDPASIPDGAVGHVILPLIEVDRSRLHQQALRIGHTRFAERSRDFEARIAGYWGEARG